MSSETPGKISIIVPTFNGALRIGTCLEALIGQASPEAEILVVNDGSTDATADFVKQFPCVRLITQANAGPAAARNRGVRESTGNIVLFTDDDCVVAEGWLSAMLAPFGDPAVVGVKGAYQTRQREVMARFIQIEYEDRYRRMDGFPFIDFIDTYSAGFRREAFLAVGGFDTSFPVACAEDADLSYRMAARQWKMRFARAAIVYHTHPRKLRQYLEKKYKFALWRVMAARKNPSKALRDSHTPQLMKLQVLFPLVFLPAVALDLIMRPAVPTSAILLGLFVCSTLPFAWRAARKDPVAGLVSPGVLALRACAQFLGIAAGIVKASRTAAEFSKNSTA